VKRKLADAINALLEPMRERRRDVLARPGYIRDMLFEGSARARREASAKLQRVRDAMKLRY
jgi:tryptophanyl-tRNA synthetase